MFLAPSLRRKTATTMTMGTAFLVHYSAPILAQNCTAKKPLGGNVTAAVAATAL